jgi:RNA polymerase sigma-70 factor (ECF subfamily)
VIPHRCPNSGPAHCAGQGKIRDEHIPYQVPPRSDLPDRLDIVLQVVYLVFNEGYAPSAGVSLTRHDLLAERVAAFIPTEP